MNDPTTLKVNGPADLISAVPYLLGFTPEHSLVAVGLKHRRLEATFRVDLPGSIDRLELLNTLIEQVRTNACTAVVLIAYGEPDIATASLERAAVDFDTHGLEILNQIRITAGRYYNLDCTKPCCPPEGQPIPEHTGIAAALVAAGMLKRPDRAAVTELFTPVAGERRAAVARAVDNALHHEADLSWTEQRQVDLTAIDEWLGATTLPEHPAEIAALGLAVGDLDVRDYTLRRSDNQREHALDLWLWVARHLDADLAAPALTLAGWCAYRTGNGVLALDAFEHALDCSPTYRLARLLIEALQAGIPPHVLSNIANTTAESTSA